MLCPSGSEFIDQVIGYIDLPVPKMFYIPGESQRYIFGITDPCKFQGIQPLKKILLLHYYLKSNLNASILNVRSVIPKIYL
jgi:hypothetical protein